MKQQERKKESTKGKKEKGTRRDVIAKDVREIFLKVEHQALGIEN